MSEREQNEFNASRGLATVDAQTVDAPLPRRPGAGLKRPTAKQEKNDAKLVNAYAVLGCVLLEVAPGVYVEAHRKPLLLRSDPVKDENGRMVATVYNIMLDTPNGR